MPEISRFYGIVVRMFFDDHNPPHFHIEYQDFEAAINIEDGIVKGEIPRRALKLVYEWLDLHKDELIENWNLLNKTGEYKKIDPLT
ncbi:MAG: transcriptional regulator [Bacteroidetes bacterium]|nr:MAG: transcriptional regulator [Bacteroidota bacterium]